MEGILTVDQLKLSYGEKAIIKDCSFTVQKGEVVVILGSSGAGKSTLLKAIAGLIPYEKGKVLFKGELVKDAANKLVPGHDEINLINQDFGLDEFHNVEENIRLKLLKYTKEYQEERIAKMLRLMGLTTFRKKKSKELSGGQKQRLAIARALADEPSFILLDEPFNQLDFKTKTRVTRHLISYLQKSKTSVLMVTHNGQEALEWSDKIMLLKNGKIIRNESTKTFYDTPQNLDEALFFGPVNKVVKKDKKIYFRPHAYRLEKDKKHSILIHYTFHQSKFMGGYYSNELKVDGQKITLLAAEPFAEGKGKVYVSPLSF